MMQIAHQFNVDNEIQKVQVKDSDKINLYEHFLHDICKVYPLDV